MPTDRMLRKAEVLSRCGVSYTTVWRWVRSGRFPAPVKIGPRAVRWRESEIEAWLAERPRALGDGIGASAA